VEPS